MQLQDPSSQCISPVWALMVAICGSGQVGLVFVESPSAAVHMFCGVRLKGGGLNLMLPYFLPFFFFFFLSLFRGHHKALVLPFVF